MCIRDRPTQHSVKELRSIGIQPDIIICRSEIPINDNIKSKISLFCDIEKEISSKQIFEGKILKVFLDNVMLPNKKIASREKVLHPGAVGVVPVTEEKNIILIKQYRYPVKDILTEIPAGKLDKDEIPINCARRELKEEIGAFGGNFIHLSSFYTTPGFSNEFLHLYLAVNFKLMKNNPEEDEFLQAVEIPLDDGCLLYTSRCV